MMENVRIDKWLWAARFYKTRSLASKAVGGGHVHLNGNRIKPSRSIAVGDQLLIRRGELTFTVNVLELSERRGPAVRARTLYEETEESQVSRQAAQEQRKLIRQPAGKPDKRPDKRERRRIREFLQKDYE